MTAADLSIDLCLDQENIDTTTPMGKNAPHQNGGASSSTAAVTGDATRRFGRARPLSLANVSS